METPRLQDEVASVQRVERPLAFAHLLGEEAHALQPTLPVASAAAYAYHREGRRPVRGRAARPSRQPAIVAGSAASGAGRMVSSRPVIEEPGNRRRK